MPHLVIHYTPDLDRATSPDGSDMTALCRALARLMVDFRDESGQAVLPVGGIRVLAYPAAHWAIADGGAAGLAAGGSGEYGFVYLNLRLGRGRGADTFQRLGRLLEQCANAHFATQLATRHVGVTVQIDEGRELFSAKTSSLHPLFARR